MNKSTFLQNFIAIALIILISFALLGGLLSAWIYGTSINANEQAMITVLQETARFITTQRVYNEVELDDLNINMLLSMTSKVTGYDILVTNTDGVVYACSDNDVGHIGRQIPLMTLQYLSSNEDKIKVAVLSNIYKEERHILAMPLQEAF